MNFKILKRILSYSKGNKKYFLISIIASIVFVASSLYIPILTGRSIDHIIGGGNVDYDFVRKTIITIGVITIIMVFAQWTMGMASNSLSYEIANKIRKDCFSHILKLPISYLDENKEGDILNRMINDIEMISTGLIQGFQQLFSGVTLILGTLCFMMYMNVAIALVVVIITPVSLFVASFIASRCHKLFYEQSKLNGEILAISEEMFQNNDIVKAFGYEEKASVRLGKVNDKLFHVGLSAQFFSAMTNPVTRFVNGIVYAVVGILGAYICVKSGLVVGGLTIVAGGITVGQLTSFLAYANQYTKPFNEISGVVTELQSAFASATRVFSIIDEKTVVDDGTIISDLKGNVDFSHVDFSYTDDKKLIENFNLNVDKGRMVAIVGPTGAGKSTMINLLMRFYECQGGNIFIDGKDIKEYNRLSYRKQIGMVIQETWLFEGTIRDNISYGKRNASLDEIILAAKMANAHSFISRLPNGYDTVINDSSSISVGEKQLLCIARVMLMEPSILILDEATSSIDTRTEMKIQEAFDKLLKGKTSFVIAHRLQTIIKSDWICVMNKGAIIEQGTHHDLMMKKGFYYDLFNRQF